MANGQIEIHDVFSGRNGITTSPESKKSTSSSGSDEDSVEFRIMMAYAQRRRNNDTSQDNPSTPTGSNASGSPPGQTEEGGVQKKKKKKKKIWKFLPKMWTCVKPQTKEEPPSPCEDGEDTGIRFRCNIGGGADEPENEFEDVADRLAEISAEIPFVPPELETDADDDVEVEKVIALLLRDAGDRLHEEKLKDMKVTDLLGHYGFFEKVIRCLLRQMGLDSNAEDLGPKVSPKTQIAVTCEATTRLSVLGTLPMNQLLGHGARFLKTYFSSWAEQQGGYEKAFDS